MDSAASSATTGGRDFFQLFGLDAAFDLDIPQLEARFRALQKQFHPDRVVGAAAPEQRMAAQLSAQINEGFRTLSDPVARAGYLLAQHGKDLRALEREPMTGEFLMQQMMLREALAPGAEDSEREDAVREAYALFDAALGTFADQWRNGDVESASSTWVELLYLNKLRQAADAKTTSES